MDMELVGQEADGPRERSRVGKGRDLVQGRNLHGLLDKLRMVLEVAAQARKAQMEEVDLWIKFSIAMRGEEGEIG